MNIRHFIRNMLTITTILIVGLMGVTNAIGQEVGLLNRANPEVRAVMAAQDLHSPELFSIAGVVGTGTGLTKNGQLAIMVYTKTDISQRIPKRIDGIPVRVLVTGEILALHHRPGHSGGPGGGGEPKPSIDPTSRFDRPVPIGVSTGNEGECSAGTIGARVKDGTNVYALSNNHVYALENNASDLSNVHQPGRFDTDCFRME